MNSQRMMGHKIMLTCSLIAAVGSALWAFLPSREGRGYTGTISPPSGRNGDSILTEAQPKVSEFPGMELWTKPPPVVVPPAPPPPLRLNAELLSIREGEPKGDRVATIYLPDTGEILRLKAGDLHSELTVEEVTESAVHFRRGNQILVIARDTQ